MARNHANAAHELDPLKGGLKHHPFAALREKLAAADGPAATHSGDAHAEQGRDARSDGGGAQGSRVRDGQQVAANDAQSSADHEAPASSATRAGEASARRLALVEGGAQDRARPVAVHVVDDQRKGSLQSSASSNSRERVTVRIERTGRGGKTVTIAEGPAFTGVPLDALARDIARGMGTGAHARGETIVAQGDQRKRLVSWLGGRGFSGAVAGN